MDSSFLCLPAGRWLLPIVDNRSSLFPVESTRPQSSLSEPCLGEASNIRNAPIAPHLRAARVAKLHLRDSCLSSILTRATAPPNVLLTAHILLCRFDTARTWPFKMTEPKPSEKRKKRIAQVP